MKLGRGEPANIRVTPALTEPSLHAEPEVIFDAFKKFVPRDLDEIDALLATSASELKEEHPFFGAFNAKQWYWSLSMRTSLRYRQLKNIRAGLSLPR